MKKLGELSLSQYIAKIVSFSHWGQEQSLQFWAIIFNCANNAKFFNISKPYVF